MFNYNLKALSELRKEEFLPFVINYMNVYRVSFTKNSYNITWLSQFFDITQVITNVKTNEVYYNVIRYHKFEITHMIINEKLFYDVFINKIIKRNKKCNNSFDKYIADCKAKACRCIIYK